MSFRKTRNVTKEDGQLKKKNRPTTPHPIETTTRTKKKRTKYKEESPFIGCRVSPPTPETLV